MRCLHPTNRHGADMISAETAAGRPAWRQRLLRRVGRIFWPAESERKCNRVDHWIWLSILVVLLVLPVLTTFDTSAAQPVPRFCGIRLPGRCLSHDVFGVDCPGCGMTRSFILVAHGRFRESLQYHRLGILLYVTFAFLAAYHAVALMRGPRGAPRAMRFVARVLPAPIILLLILNWLFNIFTRAG